MTRGYENNEIKPSFHGFYDLMKYRVNNILLVSSLYDAFTLEEDGILSERISGEFQDLSLSSPPRVHRSPTCENALADLKKQRFDVIITMSRLVDMDPFEFGRRAKELQPGVPVLLLLTDTADIPLFYTPGDRKYIDKVFFWSGDSAIFVAITKYVEDSLNLKPDTSNGIVRAILVIEDSPRYYSMFLPIIYSEIMHQTQSLIAEGLNEHEKIFRKRARPKIILAETYEEAIEKYRENSEHILGVITDVTFPRNGREEKEAGFQFVKELDPSIPVLIQSSREEHRAKAEELCVPFINKRSDTLLQDLRDFFKDCLGFGDFIFQSPDGREIARAKDVREFVELAHEVPAEVIRYHAASNHFSNWLMARGEIETALKLRPKKVEDFKSDEEMRQLLLNSIRKARIAKRKGVITTFAQQNFDFEETFTKLGSGSLGGKGRGLAFLSALMHQSNVQKSIRDCKVRVPDTLVLATDIFDRFMVENDIYSRLGNGLEDDEIARLFCEASMPDDIKSSLGTYLSHVREPLAVRSSSLLEDSHNQPFAGIYSTYMLPNTCFDDGDRLQQLCQAIKLVYASVFFKAARAYIETTVHISEEEKMAIVIQKLVGNRYGDRFYPIFSGVAQSYNYYPVAPLKREDGIVSVALGLGKLVVEGEKVLSFSPKHPDILPGFSSPQEVMKNSQNLFYALNMADACYELEHGENVTLLTLDIREAEKDGTLDYVASTYDANDNRLRDGVGGDGPKFITFSGILKYDMLPLKNVIKAMLDIGSKGMGGPVEMEFALSFPTKGRKPEFYIVQIRPLVTQKERRQVTIFEEELAEAFVYTEKALGNGVLEGIHDIIYVRPEIFDHTKTPEIAMEIGRLNRQLGRPYVLVGPGRWGTRDRFLGIPVEWDQISNARAIIEAGLENFRIDPSHGTHFFHNITSLGIMYFTVPYNHKSSSINWEWLGGIEATHEGEFTRHIHLDNPISIKVDGRTGEGIVTTHVHKHVKP